MSARPRPVTATFPPAVFGGYPEHSRNYSLSPGSSTASLVSVLDHDSCADLIDDSPIREPNVALRQTYDIEAVSHRNVSSNFGTSSAKRQQLHVSTTAVARLPRHRAKSATQQRHNCPESPSSHCDNDDEHHGLSAWEKWVLQKAKEQRTADEKKLQQQKDVERQNNAEKVRKEAKQAEAASKIQEWIEHYDEALRQKRRLQKKCTKAEQELKEEQKLEVLAKSKEKYEEWLLKKDEEASKRRQNEKEKRKVDQLEKEEKQQKGADAYRKWCDKARNRPRTSPNSFGYCAGKLRAHFQVKLGEPVTRPSSTIQLVPVHKANRPPLRSINCILFTYAKLFQFSSDHLCPRYYDASAYPEPSFYNPIPWHPIEIPQPKLRPKKKAPINKLKCERYF